MSMTQLKAFIDKEGVKTPGRWPDFVGRSLYFVGRRPYGFIPRIHPEGLLPGGGIGEIKHFKRIYHRAYL